jgi:hypothetical protein
LIAQLAGFPKKANEHIAIIFSWDDMRFVLRMADRSKPQATAAF